MTAAAALPGPGGTAAAAREPATGVEASYRYSAYSEDALPADRVAGGTSRDRYEVDTHQLDVRLPLPSLLEGTGADLDVSLQHETMSGASPWYVQPGVDGEPVQVMSGATIQDERDDLLATLNILGDDRSASVSFGYSEEDDYEALNMGLSGGLELPDGLTTLEAGIGYSDDHLEPVEAGPDDPYPSRIDSGDKTSTTVFAGISRVLNPNATVQTTFSYTHNEGYLSDPYKLVRVGTGTERDTRPDKRKQGTWLVRYRQYVEGIEGAFHANYRYYTDDWGIDAHTVRLEWYQPLPRGWRVVPSVRYHSQSEADFYAPFFDSPPGNGLYTSDYRMSPFGALSWRLRADKSFGDLELSVSYEAYSSDGSYALGDVKVENPGLVDFDVLSASVKYRFGR